MDMFIDLDGTILDTVRLIADFKRLLCQHTTEAVVRDYYASDGAAPPEYMSRTYYLIRNPHLYASILGVKDQGALDLAIQQFLLNMPEYVFEDAAKFLRLHAEANLVLLSYGGTGWQQVKIDQGGLTPLFKNVVITHGGKKTDAIKLLREQGKVSPTGGIFIDDRGKEIRRVKLAFPDITCYHVVRPNSNYTHEHCDVQDHTVNDLLAVSTYLK